MERKTKLVISLAVVITLFSMIAIQPFIAYEEVLFEDVAHGVWSGVSGSFEYRITDLETWEDLWAEMGYICRHCDPVPIIDFSTSALFVVFQGERSTSGYGTTITRIVLTTTGYTVFVDEFHPGPDCFTLPVCTQPYHIVVTNSTQNLPIEFVYNVTVVDCDSWV